ncbi:MAG: hypothetical protein AABW75_03285 [Nanoarchaeota archaeon]
MKKVRINFILSVIFLILLMSIISASEYYSFPNSKSLVYSNSYDNFDTISSSLDYHSNQERIIFKKELSESYEPRYKYIIETRYRPVIYYRYYNAYKHPDYYIYPSTDNRYEYDKYYKRYYEDSYEDPLYDKSYTLIRVYNKKCDWHKSFYRSNC